MTDIRNELEIHIPALRRYARALVKNVTSADDVVQDCLLRAIEKQHQYKSGTNLRAWLFRVMHSRAMDHFRKNGRYLYSDTPEDYRAADPGPPNQVLHLRLKNVDRHLDELPDTQRKVLLLVTLEGLTYDEVAEILDIPVGTVRSRLSRARETLREMDSDDPKSQRRVVSDHGQRPRQRRPGSLERHAAATASPERFQANASCSPDTASSDARDMQ